MKKFKMIFITLLTGVCAVVGVIFAGTVPEGLPTAEAPMVSAGPEASVEEPEVPVEAPRLPVTPPEVPEPEAPVVVMASEHFAMSEYRCDCAGSCDGWPAAMDPALLGMIEALRCACGSPVIITSGVRCEARNEEVGGVAWSFHKRGHAADLYCPGLPVGDLAALAKGVGLNVLPYYGSGYIHVEN